MKFIEWFKTFFDDNTSGASTTRALNWIWITMLVFNLTYISVSTKKLPDISNAYVLITTGLLAAKVGQRVFGEKE